MCKLVVYLGVFLCTAGSATAQHAVLNASPPAQPASPFGATTLVPELVACTDQPTTSAPATPLHIVAPHAADRRRESSRGDLVVLNGGTLHGLTVGQRYFTRRLRRPADGLSMSEAQPGAIRTSGWLTIVAADERTAIGRVDYACVAVDAGDYLAPYAEPVLPAVAASDGAAPAELAGRVLFGRDGRESFGPGDLLSIDLGATQGLAGGTRLVFYRDRRNGTPLFEIGTGVVVEVSTGTSKVIVDRARQVITMGDLFGVRR
jgi:hypothetical protein